MINTLIPYLICLMMFTVGTNLTLNAFSEIKQNPGHYLWATLGQVLILPLVALLLIYLLQPKSEIAVGLLLVSMCPAGAVSNLYAYIGKANVALSVTLTMLTNLVAIISLPLVLILLFATTMTSTQFVDFTTHQIYQLVVVLFVPMFAGAAVQHFFPHFLIKAKKLLDPLTFLALTAIIASIFVTHIETIKREFLDLLIPAASFTLCGLATAKAFAAMRKLDSKDTAAYLAEFPSRNLALVAMISVTFLGNSEYLVFAAMFLVVESPIILFLMLRHRSKISGKW